MAKPLLPAPYVVFKDGQLPKGPLPSGIFVFIGVGESGAAAGVLTPVNSPNDIRGLFGTGPLVGERMVAKMDWAGQCVAHIRAEVEAEAPVTPALPKLGCNETLGMLFKDQLHAFGRHFRRQ